MEEGGWVDSGLLRREGESARPTILRASKVSSVGVVNEPLPLADLQFSAVTAGAYNRQKSPR